MSQFEEKKNMEESELEQYSVESALGISYIQEPQNQKQEKKSLDNKILIDPDFMKDSDPVLKNTIRGIWVIIRLGLMVLFTLVLPMALIMLLMRHLFLN